MTPDELTPNTEPLAALLLRIQATDVDLLMTLEGLRDAMLGYRKSARDDESYSAAFEAAQLAGLTSLCASSTHAPSPMCELIGCTPWAS